MEYNAVGQSYLSPLLATHEQSDIITPHRLVGISSPLELPTTSIILVTTFELCCHKLYVSRENDIFQQSSSTDSCSSYYP